ncbi:MAG: BlaI/MecI/CopY family transcriptional regulator [Gammaproteobacteria bacterium]|nr:BlaI/MecI/CopY family transcriptional regulator [Gammaproteobacteria bacterium]MDE1983606.1 BlaI/MecI/CopY family transcriptional regulator [Gammaproteobacteria bacterium]MDE2107817.1 BlaI/MecI/CopY family transcriptional regulator [Gammaproteobacteria bacterium]MDE2459741.1 BlaI/MecI/CopY family transcriptional regulator [Gammaproteobacteria bacterium]
MSPRRARPNHPTEAELEILNVLWKRGPSTVGEVHTEILEHSRVGYTTILKLMQIMFAKGLVERDESTRAHIYKPTSSREHTQRQMLSRLTQRAFGGSVADLVLQALGSGRRSSAAELARIRVMIDELEKRQT